MVAIEEIFSYQFSFADIEADKYIEYRRSHADPRIHAMDRLTDDGVDELVKLCLPFSHRECQDFCVWGGYSRGSPTRLPFVFEMQYARPDAIAGAKVEGPARSAGGSSLAPAIARREAAGALAREV